MKGIIAALVVATALGLGGGLASGADLPELKPMPKKFKNIQIVTPSPDTPKEIADFAGVWEGVWKKKYGQPRPWRRGKLIVYEVFDNKVRFLFAIGDNPYSAIPGGWGNTESEIEDFEGKKVFSHPGKYGKPAYFYLENGKLMGKLYKWEIEMTRVK